VGSNKTMRCNVRIIAATHRDLDEAISAGRFREDLFYRLNVFPIQMPALRERLDDLPVLIDHLLKRQTQGGAQSIRLDSSALDCLSQHPWPGNVRELSNLLERLNILFPGQKITAEDLPERYQGTALPAEKPRLLVTRPALKVVSDREDDLEDFAPVIADDDEVSDVQVDELLSSDLPRGGIDLKDHLSAIEVGLIRKALEEADGTVAEAARLLRIRRTTLVEKLRKYRLTAA
jgi:sigma-54 specific flagellar transcriptional regulator A